MKRVREVLGLPRSSYYHESRKESMSKSFGRLLKRLWGVSDVWDSPSDQAAAACTLRSPLLQRESG